MRALYTSISLIISSIVTPSLYADASFLFSDTPYLAATTAEKMPPPCIPDQLATLTTDTDLLIGGLVHPLSGNLYLHENDFTAVGAQEIPVKRTYIAPHMPHVFHRHFDQDCYHRRNYLLSSYEGWRFFPHTSLWYDRAKSSLRLTDPNGAAYTFTVSDGKAVLVHSYAVSNVGHHTTPSGRHDPRNISFLERGDTLIFSFPDGTVRHYKKREDTLYCLRREVMPNGKLLRYRYTKAGELVRIDSFDPKGRHLYASIQIEGSPKEGATRMFSSTGLSASYTYENRHVNGRFRAQKKTTRYCTVMPPLLTHVNSPQNQKETITYASISLLLDAFSGREKNFTIRYAPFGEPSHCRVAQLCFPTAPGEACTPQYTMEYEPAKAGERGGSTTVIKSNGTKRVYHFSHALLTTSIQDFAQDGTLKKEKIFSWDVDHRLASIEVRDGHKNLLLKKRYEYDPYGNPTLETLIGDLQGIGEEDLYSIKRKFSQDGRNLLLREEKEGGTTTHFTYLPDTNLLTSKLTKKGKQLLIEERFQYDACHNLVRKTLTSREGEQTITTYRLKESPPFLHMPQWIEEAYLDAGKEKLIKRVQLTYDRWGNVSEENVFDANGDYAYTIARTFDEQGNLLHETNPLGQKRTFVYDERGRCIARTNASHTLTEKMRYDERGHLCHYQADGSNSTRHTASYEYDAHNLLAHQVDTYGNRISYVYDPLFKRAIETHFPPIATVENRAAPVSTTAAYDTYGQKRAKTDANGNTTLYRYNAYGSPTEISYPNGSVERYTYTKDGKVATHTDQEGLTIHFSYDVLGRVVSKEYSDHLGEEQFSYDSMHLLEETDLEGNTTCYSYDKAGRKICEERAGRSVRYAYDSLGRVATIYRGDLQIHFRRDLLGRILEEKKTDSDGNLLAKVDYRYDEEGNLSSVTRYIDGQEGTETHDYDPFGREVAVEDPHGERTTITYCEEHTNALGQKVLQKITTNPDKSATIETQDPFGRIVKEERVSHKGDVIGGFEKYYDPNGNVTDWKEHIYLGNTYQNTQWTRYTYSNMNTITSVTRAFGTPQARTTHYTYTPSGKVATKRLPDGITLAYTYNLLGFLSALESSDGAIKHRFCCDKNGQLIETHDDVEKLSIYREIDPFGNVLCEQFPDFEFSKSYDALDRPTSLYLPKIGTITYSYDPLFLRKIERFCTNGKLCYSHCYERYDCAENACSERMIFDLGEIAHRFDRKGRQIELHTPYFKQRCTYDVSDRLIQNDIDAHSTAYRYDDLGQLIGEDHRTYGYDSAYNRVEKEGERLEINPLNECTALTYDLNGNTTAQEGVTYRYDPLNRLREATFSDKKICFFYDPLGRRLAKVRFDKTSTGWQESEKERYLYDGPHEIGAVSPDGTLKNFRVLGEERRPKQPSTIAVEIGAHTYAPITDVQGNLCCLINPTTKKSACTIALTAFGEEKEETIDLSPWRFACKRLDRDLNLIYFGKRDYAPNLGRWLTPDPAGFIDSINLYQYALNNPFAYYDPKGEFLFVACIPFAALLSATAVKICVDALAIGIGSYGVYKGVQYAANSMNVPYMLNENTWHTLINKSVDLQSYNKIDRKTKKHREHNYPGSPEDLSQNPDWKETTHPGQAKSGRRVFENTKNGEVVEYDEGRSDQHGHRKNDHYHRQNPNTTGNGDAYLDKDGNPCPKGSDQSHLYPPEGGSWT